jgi:hypothetical protein
LQTFDLFDKYFIVVRIHVTPLFLEEFLMRKEREVHSVVDSDRTTCNRAAGADSGAVAGTEVGECEHETNERNF